LPSIVEDLSISVSDDIKNEDIVGEIQAQSGLITTVDLKRYIKDSRTFILIIRIRKKI